MTPFEAPGSDAKVSDGAPYSSAHMITAQNPSPSKRSVYQASRCRKGTTIVIQITECGEHLGPYPAHGPHGHLVLDRVVPTSQFHILDSAIDHALQMPVCLSEHDGASQQ